MPVESVSELYRAFMLTYERCIKAKPAIKKSRFPMEYAQEIYRLAWDIVHRRYAPSVSNVFVVFYPNPREIIAAHLRDRIVHHHIYESMAPCFLAAAWKWRQMEPVRKMQDEAQILTQLNGFQRFKSAVNEAVADLTSTKACIVSGVVDLKVKSVQSLRN